MTHTVIAWIHPKNGGDDYQVELKVEALSKDRIAPLVEKWLKRRSIVTNDYEIVS